MNAAEIAKIAFDLHEKDLLSRDDLVCVLQECVNCAALENGYADVHVLPFPRSRVARRRSRRAP